MPAALVTNPVLIFFIVLVIILLAPVLLNRLKVPHIIGMIVAGVIVGPYGFHVLDNDTSFEIFGKVGLLYLMFLAGIEIDMYHLRLNLRRGLVFGLLTFLLPMAVGVAASVYLLHLDMITSVLLASMYASHTLIAYPVTARFGITKSPAVLIAIVGTIIAVIGALLVLAAAVNIHRTGGFDVVDLLLLLGQLIVYCLVVLYTYPRITRWFFKNFSDRVTQFVFVLALVFLAAWFAQVIGLEAVLGAFFAGLVLNRFVPDSSPLMSRIEFVGNALFIPYFLIGVGMMIDVRVIANADTLLVALNMIAVALAGKWIAAWLGQKIYRMDADDRRIMFGLTTAHTAVALAVVTIGYDMILPDGRRMMDETILNGTVLMILVTCAIAPMVTARAAARVKIRMLGDDAGTDDVHRPTDAANTLIPVSNPITAQGLVELAMLIQPRGQRNIYAVHVRNDNSASARAVGRNALDLASGAAASADVPITPIERYDLSTVTGLLNIINERDIDQVVLGLHRKATMIDSFLGSKIEQLLRSTNRMLLITRCFIPVNTVRRIVVWVPRQAQYETGFSRWVSAVGYLAREIGCRVIFCCSQDVGPIIASVLKQSRIAIRSEFRKMDDWDDFLLIANRIIDDDLFVVVSARPNSVSYSNDVAEMPSFLQRYFARTNLIVVYPEQFGTEVPFTSFVDPMASDINSAPSPLWTAMSSYARRASGLKRRLFGDRRPPRITP
ncbi:MAG: cation:proton antiporter [Muribaculaceae bacterium]|nr:cation:proton antiporter [Muribaculaceae bacterium]